MLSARESMVVKIKTDFCINQKIVEKNNIPDELLSNNLVNTYGFQLLK